MAISPNADVTQQDLNEWYRLQSELKRVKTSELLFRNKIFGAYFPDPVEGTNSAKLEEGFVLKAKYSINREVDPGAFGALKELFISAGIFYDAMVQYKPALVLKEYRSLTNEQRRLFDRALIIKPGTPSLEIV